MDGQKYGQRPTVDEHPLRKSGGLESRATDFGSESAHSGGLESGGLESGGLESGDLESGGLESGGLES